MSVATGTHHRLVRPSAPIDRAVVLHSREVAFRDYPGTGVPLMLVHGVGSTSDGWEPAAELLAATGARVIAVDLPGHGRSAKGQGDYSLGAMASTLRDLLDVLEIPRAVIVGHSLGGGIALQFTYQFPERCAGLVLVASGGLGAETNMALRLMSMPGAGVVLKLGLTERTISMLQRLRRVVTRVGAEPRFLSEAVLTKLARLSTADHRQSFLMTLRSVVDHSGQRVSALEKLHLSGDGPVLIVWGAKDGIIPLAHGEKAHAQLPGSQFEVFDESGHEPHRSEPERFAELVAAWHDRNF